MFDKNTPEKTFNDRIVITDLALSKLDSIRKWAMFFAVLGFIGVGLMLIMGVGIALIPTQLLAQFQPNAQYQQMPHTALQGIKLSQMTVLILFSLLYFFPVLYMYRFAVRTKKAILSNSDRIFEEALKALNTHFQIIGIITIIMLSLYFIIFVFAFLFGSMLA